MYYCATPHNFDDNKKLNLSQRGLIVMAIQIRGEEVVRLVYF